MATRIALLRAINVGGHRKIAMAELRDLMAELGFSDMQSILQTGNLVFSCKALSGTALERHLEIEAEKRLGFCAEFCVRSDRQWARVIADNPFPVEAERDPSRLIVLFLKKAPSASGVEALQAAIRGPEIVRGVGNSRLTSSLIERKLGTLGTGRNWNTVLKIGKLASG